MIHDVTRVPWAVTRVLSLDGLLSERLGHD